MEKKIYIINNVDDQAANISHLGAMVNAMRKLRKEHADMLQKMEAAMMLEEQAKPKDMKTKNKMIRAALQEDTPQPMRCAVRNTTGWKGEAKGTIALRPLEVDEITRDAWLNIYKGNPCGGKTGVE